jgi:hypothetical protein
VGSGGPNVVINNEHGSIQIRKASLALAVPPPSPKPPAPPSSPHEPAEPTEN